MGHTLDRHQFVRTACVNGARVSNVARTMLRLGDERAGAVRRSSSGCCSSYDLAKPVFAFAGMDVGVTPTTSEAFASPAPRPSWSVLDDQRARTQGLSALAQWREGLERMLVEFAEWGGQP